MRDNKLRVNYADMVHKDFQSNFQERFINKLQVSVCSYVN